MIIDATFWVAISFIIFVSALIYLKIPGKIKNLLNDNINKIKEEEYIQYFKEFSINKIKFLKGTKEQRKRSFINYFTYRGWENSLIYQKLNDIN